MESKIDWITLVIKPENTSLTFQDCLTVLSEQLRLGDLIKLMVDRYHIAFYEYSLTYEDIIFSWAEGERFKKQGACISFSSTGLDFFARYLDTYGLSLRDWLGEFRALCFQGWVTRCTRLDYAMDDKRLNGDLPVLTMRKIVTAIKNHDFNIRAFKICDKSKGSVDVSEDCITDKSSSFVGRTVYIGSRRSDVCIRFYDKLVEQMQKKQSVDDFTSWVRCEAELKNDRAMSVFNAFIDLSSDDFNHYMCGVINRYVCFINRDNNNISRCSVKRWWTAFLNGCTKKFKLPHRVPARSAFARSSRGLHQYLPTIYTLVQTIGFEGVYQMYTDSVAKASENNIDLYKPELAQNIIDCVNDYEEMTAFKRYQFTSFDDGTSFDIGEQMHKSHLRYVSRIYDYTHDKFRQEQHIKFCEGAEIL